MIPLSYAAINASGYCRFEKPYGFCDCQCHVSWHISSSVFLVFQPRSRSALVVCTYKLDDGMGSNVAGATGDEYVHTNPE